MRADSMGKRSFLLLGIPTLILAAWLVWPALSTLALASPLVVWASVMMPHRRPPTPKGMSFRVSLRQARTPADHLGLLAVERDGPAVAIYEADDSSGPAVLRILRYPDGSCLQRFEGNEAILSWRAMQSADETAGRSAEFDFDGDGTTDRVVVPRLAAGPVQHCGVTIAEEEWGLVEIRSGRNDRLLFTDSDPIEYENPDRAYPLPDLDGDGCSELALVHPRMDRSRYDPEPVDLLLGASSWVTLVSGARATRR